MKIKKLMNQLSFIVYLIQQYLEASTLFTFSLSEINLFLEK